MSIPQCGPKEASYKRRAFNIKPLIFNKILNSNQIWQKCFHGPVCLLQQSVRKVD